MYRGTSRVHPAQSFLATSRTPHHDQAVGSTSQLSQSNTTLLPASKFSSGSGLAVPNQALSTSTSLLGSQSIDTDDLEPNEKTQPSISETKARDEPCDTSGSGGGQARSDNGKDSLQTSKPSSSRPKKDQGKSLWDLAYQKLGTESEDLVKDFKKVLSRELSQTSAYGSKYCMVPPYPL